MAGNETQLTIEISNIDNSEIDETAPEVTIEYSTKQLTRDNVIVTIQANEEIQEVEDWILSDDKRTLTKEYKKYKQ